MKSGMGGLAAGFLVTVMMIGTGMAQEYPAKPVRVITALSAGGTSDVFARALGERFQQRTGQPMIIENRPGGAFNISGQACSDAPPDGYTICLLPIETLAYNRFLFKKLAYDATTFEPITNALFVTAGLVVNSSLNVKSLDDLAAASKAKPKTMSYMSPAVPLAHFMEVWKKESGADIVKVPYRGGADATSAILGGSTPVAFAGIANFISHVKGGAMTALAIDLDKRTSLWPDVPTLRELGYKGPLTPAYFGYVAPKGTPKAAIDRLHKLIVEIGSDKDFVARNMTNLGLIPIFDTPDQFAAYLKENRVLAERIVKESGLEPQ